MEEPQKPKPVIVQIESEDFYRAVAGLILFDLGLEIRFHANNLRQTDDLLRQISSGRIKPDIAIIDSLIEYNHEEGGRLAARLKALVPKIKIIAYTIIPDQPWADYVAVKSNLDPSRTLIKGLEELFGLKLESNN